MVVSDASYYIGMKRKEEDKDNQMGHNNKKSIIG
jgi:hypothetical protein